MQQGRQLGASEFWAYKWKTYWDRLDVMAFKILLLFAVESTSVQLIGHMIEDASNGWCGSLPSKWKNPWIEAYNEPMNSLYGCQYPDVRH